MEKDTGSRLDVKPLPQPSSKEVGSLIRGGLAQRATDHETSPTEAKQQRILERYIQERNTLAAILIASRISPRIIGEQTRVDINEFVTVDRATQQKMHHAAVSRVDVALSSIFEPNLALHEELSIEAGATPDLLQRKMAYWHRIFKNATRRERVDISIRLREINDQILLARFPSYTQEWERMLTERMGLSGKEAEAQRTKLEENFDRASDLGKIGISRTLREKIFEASEVSFNLGISTLGKLRAARGISVDSEKFPDPSRLKALYQASSPEGRNYINDLIKDACDRLITHVRKSKRP